MDILLIFVIFIAVMWFLMIRPQQKRQREHKQMIESLARGDDVITIGGMHGRVDGIAEGYVDLEVTDDLILRFQKEAIARKVVAGDPESATS
jgi:preprotein translocase subunit YajC